MPQDNVCRGCNKSFTSNDKRQKYCCKQCFYANFPHNRITVKCSYCGKPKEIYPSRNDGRHTFCDKVCMDSWQKTSRLPAVGKKVLAKACLVCRRTFKGQYSRTKFCSDGCRLQYLNEYPYGENNPSWRGGTTTGRRKLEKSFSYKRWRLSVYKRDKYRCVLCGASTEIQAHHIKPLSLYPELSTRLDNGATLCKECHLKTYSKEDRFERLFYCILRVLQTVSACEPRVAIV